MGLCRKDFMGMRRAEAVIPVPGLNYNIPIIFWFGHCSMQKTILPQLLTFPANEYIFLLWKVVGVMCTSGVWLIQTFRQDLNPTLEEGVWKPGAWYELLCSSIYKYLFCFHSVHWRGLEVPKCPRKSCFYDLSNLARCTKQEELTRKAVCVQFPAQFCKFTWQNHHSESSLATARERGDSLTCLTCCKSTQRPKHAAGACAGSGADRDIPAHPWTEERGRGTTQGKLFALPFADETELQQTLGLLQPAPATGTLRDPMSNTHRTSLLWFTVWMPLSALVIQTPHEWRQVGTQEGDSSCPYV